jgi:hypothetical protein
MSEIYFVIIIVLFTLAVFDLFVGVSNDAVNFLNSAIGSKAAPKWIIFGVASLGILAGATFSDGMMEIARKGIFNPQMFFFSDVMTIFLAVIVTDILVIDLFNTYGFPTSTSVSVVFELLGASVSVSLIKIKATGDSIATLGKYINSEKALIIITGILVSIVIAFVVGAFIHWLTRFLFSFRYEKKLKYLGSIYGGLAIAFITYFLIVIGAKGASFMTPEVKERISTNMVQIFLCCFIFWTITLQIFRWLFKIDILKIIVLVGTFALAMAFAGNDMVNFIGVPLAGFASFNGWIASGLPANEMTMEFLSGEVRTPSYFLIIAGLIMAVTLVTSKKSRMVVKTSVDLSRQSEGEERFESSAISRFVVSVCVSTSQFVSKITPKSVSRIIAHQFEPIPVNNAIALTDQPAFDKLRAASNLMVASILISVGTSLKLPLSTTYVTFMVAMATSLTDRAWGRESAVYRVSGVFAVIGGWFLTALVSFTAALIMAQIIFWGGNVAKIVLPLIVIFIMIRSQIFFKRKSEKEEVPEEEDLVDSNENASKILEKCNKNTIKAIISTSKAYFLCFEGFFNDDKQQLKNAMQEVEEFNSNAKQLKNNVLKSIQKLQQDQIETGHYYVQIIDYIREMAHSINFVVKPVYTHFENKHKPFNEEQIAQFNDFGIELNNFFNFSLHLLKEKRFEDLEELIVKRDLLVEKLKNLEKSQIKRIKNNAVSTRNSVLYLNIISETKSLLFNLINVIKAQRDFMNETKLNSEKTLR